MGMRRKAREFALRAVFENDFNNAAFAAVIDRVQHESQPEPEVLQFLTQLLDAYENKKSDINELIEKHSNNWKLFRMASVDRNILRLGVTEILTFDDIPKSVSINEYLEIAKKYGTEESSSFVNGILDKIEKNKSA